MRIYTCIIMACLATGFAFAQTPSAKPFVLGYTEQIQSAELKEKRILNIYLPDGYQQKDSVTYPVIYLLDGSADEDFIHIAGLVQFNNFPWIDRVPKSIVVGIANVDRKRDFTYPTTITSDKKQFPTTGDSVAFINFIEKEIQPFIQNKYKGRKQGTLIGQSLGGLLATEILLKKPALFNRYIIISPSIWWDNGSVLNHISSEFEKGITHKTVVYVGVGKEGPTPGSFNRIMEDDAKLLADKLKNIKNKNLPVYFDYLPEKDHADITHQAVSNAFLLFYPKAK